MFNNYKKFDGVSVSLILAAVFVFSAAGCRHKNIELMPSQGLEMPAPTKTPFKSNNENKEQNMNQSKMTAVPPSSWGATGIGVVVTENGVKIEYDCAIGEIKQKLMVDENGEFEADGFHTPEGFGPTRTDNPPKSQPAHYTGKISGDTLTLRVKLMETKEQIADYTLERGRTPRLRKCY